MNSDNNKRLLWKLLYDKQYFAKFNNSQFGEIKTLFDTVIIEVNNTTQGTILEKNKLFILEFIKRLNSINIPYKREDIINHRKDELLDNFNKKNDELNEFKPVKPTDIDFSDNIKEPPIDLLKNVSLLNKQRDSEIPIMQQILTILKDINHNQQEILNILNNPEPFDNILPETNLMNSKSSDDNILPKTDLMNSKSVNNIQSETDLININE